MENTNEVSKVTREISEQEVIKFAKLSKLYNVYTQIRHRCNNPKNHAYHKYGARGIKICEQWQGEDGFVNFYTWSINNGYEFGLSVDRINNDGNYDPDNCRYTTRTMQQFNRGLNKNNKTGFAGVEMNGEKYIAHITKDGIPYHLGTFDTVEDAAKARREKEIELYGFSIQAGA